MENKLKKEKRSVTPTQLRKECRTFAKGFVDVQREEFKRLGVLADWENPYLTMTYDYEAEIARKFGEFVEQGYVYQGKKPVYWCPTCKTALAEAEVEYKDIASPSIYVKFPFTEDFYEKFPQLKGKDGYVVIWTTTPWTLPANLAIALHPEFDYVIEDTGDELLLFAEGLSASFHQATGIPQGKVVLKAKGTEFENLRCKHPFIDRYSIVILGEHVTLDAGTGCVHTAPGHGEEDYEVGLKYGLEPYAPVNEEGRFTSDVPEYQGRFVFDTDKEIIQLLKDKGLLIKEEKLTHAYPHCWRSHDPVIFRATPQWFISVDHNDLRKKAIDEIGGVRFVPKQGYERLRSMLESRPDWCISRQRAWGVPIIAFTCQDCGEIILDENIVYHVAEIFAEKGADAWFELDVKDLVPQGFKCPKCGSKHLTKEETILDVWFDSGVSWSPVIKARYGDDAVPDLYLEGSDQHRGWFQSSLLAAVGTTGKAPYKTVVTHGFVVDGQGKKLSKSAGNFIPPERIINRYGVEILRLWVAAEDYKDDIRISDEILKTLVDAYRKFRNTFRFMLGNLSDFDPNKDMLNYDELLAVDKYALSRFSRLIDKVLKAYENFDFHVIYHTLVEYTFKDLSAFYLDISKDRLYCEVPWGKKRRSTQTVFYKILRGMLIMLAPILSFTTEEAYQELPKLENDPDSIFLLDMINVQDYPFDEVLEREFEVILDIRKEVLAVLENSRKVKEIGHPLEATIVLQIGRDSRLLSIVKKYKDALAEYFVVSAVEIEETDGKDIHIIQKKAEGSKCNRCWMYSPTVGQDPEFPDVCARCASVLRTVS